MGNTTVARENKKKG